MKRTINISVWPLAAHILISALILNSVVWNNKHVVAELSVIPLWNVTINETDAEPCGLGIDSNLPDVVKLIGDTVKTCNVQLTSSNGTAALICIPQGAFVYTERQENILNCQMKYVSLTANESCFVVSRHPKLQLFLRVDSANSSSVTISQMTVNTSAPICPDGTSSNRQHTSKVSQTNHCQAREFDDLISCNLPRNNACSFKFSDNCNVTLGNREVEFHCLVKIAHSSHKALIIYPPGIITLDLARQSIVELKVNPFMTLKSLKRLLLDYNDLVVLPRGFLSGLRNLDHLTLSGNRLSSLDGNMFNDTTELGELILRDNNLKQLPNNLFNGMGNLKKLNLRNNYLTVLPKGLFMGLTNLEYLDLSRNQINSLDEALFNRTNRLTELTLYQNDLKVLPKELLKVLKHLEILNLGENQINLLDGNLFNETKNFTYLSFDYNNLVYLTNTLFRGLSDLHTLSLDNNKIIEIHVEMLRDLVSLQVLSLSDNRLKALNFNLFQYTRKLRVLNLSYNELLNIPDISSLAQLFYLNVKKKHIDWHN